MRAILPRGQKWFYERMQQLGYAQAYCHGVAYMGMQAILADETDIFDKRLALIYDIPVADFNQTLGCLRQKRVALQEEIKKNISGMTSIPESEKQRLLNDKIIKNKLTKLLALVSQLVQEGKLKESDREAEYEHRKNKLLFNAFLQEKIALKLATLPEDEAIKLDIPPFFDGLALYQNPDYYPDCFAERDGTRLISQDASLVLPIVISQRLEEQGGVVLSDRFSGLGEVNELAAYFASFSELAKQSAAVFAHPIAFVLMNVNHTMTIGFDPCKDEWRLINANRLPTQYFKNVNQLAETIIDGFSSAKDGFTIFNIAIYANKADEALLAGCLVDWKNQPAWQAVHTASSERAQKIDVNNVSWLYMAAQNAHRQEVKALLAAGANPNQATSDSLTPLYMAVANGDIEVVQVLISAGADLNQATDYGTTPLCLAVRKGHTEVLQALLVAGADPNQAMKDGLTPLCLAIKNACYDIVLTLLDRMNPRLPIKIDKKSLRKLANKGGEAVETRMLDLILDKISASSRFFDDSITISAAELAWAIGKEAKCLERPKKIAKLC